MSNLTRITNMDLQVEQAFDAAKHAAIEEFASARVEEVMLKAAETRLAVLEARRQLVLRTFNVTDVASLGEHLSKNKFAAEKLQGIFGGTFELLKDQTGRPLCDIQVVKDDPDVGEVRIYTYYGRYTRPDGLMVEQMGSFSTKDQFFAKAQGEWKRLEEIDVTSVMVAAQTECYKKCIFRGAGLGDWTPADAAQIQSGAKGHDFKGSATTSKPVEDLVIPFGREKGKKLSEASDDTLGYVLKGTQASLEDPDKAKYRKSNEKMLGAVKAEIERRKAPSQEDAPNGGKGEVPPPDKADSDSRVEDARQPAGATAAPAEPLSRGKLVGEAWTKLNRVTKDDAKKAIAVLKLVSTEKWTPTGPPIGLLTDCTDAQLGELLAIPDDILVTAAATIK